VENVYSETGESSAMICRGGWIIFLTPIRQRRYL